MSFDFKFKKKNIKDNLYKTSSCNGAQHCTHAVVASACTVLTRGGETLHCTDAVVASACTVLTRVGECLHCTHPVVASAVPALYSPHGSECSHQGAGARPQQPRRLRAFHRQLNTEQSLLEHTLYMSHT